MYRSILRLGFAIAATIAVCSSAYASSTETIPTSGPGWGNVIVFNISHVDYALDIAPLALFKEQPSAVTRRGYHSTEIVIFANKTRVAGAAVLATTQAGWRSGRLRKLSG